MGIQLYNVIHHFWKTNIIQPTSGTSGPLHIEWSDADFVWALDLKSKKNLSIAKNLQMNYRSSSLPLVGDFNPFEKYESQLGLLFPIYGNIKNVPNHQPVHVGPWKLIPGRAPCITFLPRQMAMRKFIESSRAPGSASAGSCVLAFKLPSQLGAIVSRIWQKQSLKTLSDHLIRVPSRCKTHSIRYIHLSVSHIIEYDWYTCVCIVNYTGR